MATPKKTGDSEIGARITARREALGLSRRDLADETGLSYPYVSQIETGYRMPAARQQAAIARVLGSSLDELFGAADSPLSESGASDSFALGMLSPARRSTPLSIAADVAPELAVFGSLPAGSAPPSRPSLDDAVDAASAALEGLPANRRLDALARVGRRITEGVADAQRRQVGSSSQPSGWVERLAPNEVFVFGSNGSGTHGGGAARTAFERFGAVWGEGHGLHGQSYAIDTMSGADALRHDVEEFLAFAEAHPELRFLLTPIGTGIAGYRADEIAPLFADAPDNVVLPAEFL